VSTTVLLKKVAKAYDKSAILLPVPTGILKLLARLMGKKDVVGRLLSTLQVDSNKARQLLNWTPVVTMDEQLKRIVELEK
jgi:nucleoside-diphosphate-sugar epimerase